MKHAILLPLALCFVACGTVDKPTAPPHRPAPPPAKADADVPKYCIPKPSKANAKRYVCENNIFVTWTSEEKFVVSVEHEPFAIPRPDHPDLKPLPLFARWVMPRASAGERFVFVIPRGDGVFLHRETGEFDGDKDEDTEDIEVTPAGKGEAVAASADGVRRGYRWRVTNQLKAAYDYSIVFHRKANGELTHRISCDPKIVDLPQALITLKVNLTDCVATKVEKREKKVRPSKQ